MPGGFATTAFAFREFIDAARLASRIADRLCPGSAALARINAALR